MFERFTERARQVVVLAQEEARTLRTDFIGVEHMFLGLLREEEGLAARVLNDLHFDTDTSRMRLVDLGLVPTVDKPIGGQIPFTEPAKAIMESALREALSLGHNYIGTEHLLLGMIRHEMPADTPLSRLLDEKGVTRERIREEVIRMLTGRKSPPPEYAAANEAVARAAAAAGHEFPLASDPLKEGWYVETWTHDEEGVRHGPWETKPTVDNFGANPDTIVFSVPSDGTQPMLILTISSYASIALAHTEEDEVD